VEHVAELLAIAVVPRRRRVGRALVDAVRRRASERGCDRLIVVTTDDNSGAQAFYAASGFTLADRRVGAVDECRRAYKPSIPAGAHDELEYVDDLGQSANEEVP
jgi:ribosomal protein S18 acetylase RimI-like enzyme